MIILINSSLTKKGGKMKVKEKIILKAVGKMVNDYKGATVTKEGKLTMQAGKILDEDWMLDILNGYIRVVESKSRRSR